MFASPDVGGIKRARSFAKFFDAELAVCDKYRKEANKIESMRLIGEVDGKDVILVDDLVDTAGTICKAASLLKEKGAKSGTGSVYTRRAFRKSLRQHRRFFARRNCSDGHHSFEDGKCIVENKSTDGIKPVCESNPEDS